MKNIYLIGAGGHCKSCIDVIEMTGLYKIAGLFDLKKNQGQKIGNYEIIGADEDIHRYVKAGNEFLLTMGQIKSAELRIKTANLLKDLGAVSATVISPRAYVSKTATVKAGSIIMHDAIVNAYAQVGEHCILNTRSLVEHDAVVEDFCHVSTGAVLNGNAHVKQKSFIGSLSVLQEGLVVPEGSVLSAGVFHKKTRM
jgi:sugar O-acyltransferase (sialic acid O-acetyltransferase NeuD family)